MAQPSSDTPPSLHPLPPTLSSFNISLPTRSDHNLQQSHPSLRSSIRQGPHQPLRHRRRCRCKPRHASASIPLPQPQQPLEHIYASMDQTRRWSSTGSLPCSLVIRRKDPLRFSHPAILFPVSMGFGYGGLEGDDKC